MEEYRQTLTPEIIADPDKLQDAIQELALQPWRENYPDVYISTIRNTTLLEFEIETVKQWKTDLPEHGCRVSCFQDLFFMTIVGEMLYSFIALRGNELVIEDLRDAGESTSIEVWQEIYDHSPEWRRSAIIARAKRYDLIIP